MDTTRKRIAIGSLLILAVSFFISCTSSESSFIKILDSVDKSIYSSGQESLSKLNSFKTDYLSPNERAMYNLVYAIAYNEVHHDFKNDTLITSALAYFKNNEDDYNYCRALLFKGITLLNRSKSDQAAVSFLKQAQDIQESEKFSDTLLQFNLNLYMGKALRYRSEYAKAEIHYSKAFDIATKSGKVSDQLIVRLELFWSCLSQRKFKEALENIIEFEDQQNLTPEIVYSLYNALASYHNAKREFDIAIAYLKKMQDLDRIYDFSDERSKLYYTLALYFTRSENLDSSMHYAVLATKAITDSISLDNHFYFRYLAGIQEKKGEYKEALDNYKEAYKYYISAYTKHNKTRFAEIEKKYDLSSVERNLRSTKRFKEIFLVSIILILFLSGFVIILLYKRLRMAKGELIRCRFDIEEQQKRLENNLEGLNQLSLTNELLGVQAELYSKLTEEIHKLAAKTRKGYPELAGSIDKTADDTKTIFRNRLAAIAEKLDDSNLLKNNDFSKELSDMEKMILVLWEMNYSTSEIALLLGISQASVRSIKVRIKDKTSTKNCSKEVDSDATDEQQTST